MERRLRSAAGVRTGACRAPPKRAGGQQLPGTDLQPPLQPQKGWSDEQQSNQLEGKLHYSAESRQRLSQVRITGALGERVHTAPAAMKVSRCDATAHCGPTRCAAIAVAWGITYEERDSQSTYHSMRRANMVQRIESPLPLIGMNQVECLLDSGQYVNFTGDLAVFSEFQEAGVTERLENPNGASELVSVYGSADMRSSTIIPLLKKTDFLATCVICLAPRSTSLA